MTVEEVATLAARLGWGYEELMSMTLAERRLWLAASERFDARTAAAGRPPADASVPHAQPATTAAATPVSESTTPAGPPGPGAPAPSPAPLRLSTEAERRARLLELLQEEAARYQRR